MDAEQKIPFKEWISNMKRDYPLESDNNKGYVWRRLDEYWLVSSRENESYYQKAFHLCPISQERMNNTINLDGKCPCGNKVPEGIRMIAMLLESL